MGIYLIETILSGEIAFYINGDRFTWIVWIGALILLAMGGASLYELLTNRPKPATAPRMVDDFQDNPQSGSGHDHAGHAHAAGGVPAPSWMVLAALALPILFGILIPAKPLGAAAVQNTGMSNDFTGVNANGVIDALSIPSNQRNVLDWIRAFNTSQSFKEFEGQEADVIGFIYRDIRFKEDSQLMIARFTVSCCVADASALGVMVQTTDAAKWSQDTWVRVRGKFQVQTFNDQLTPVLVAEVVETTPQPKNPYLYP
jgi:uncharacterized repeat protein (TIGR03943 family)